MSHWTEIDGKKVPDGAVAFKLATSETPGRFIFTRGEALLLAQAERLWVHIEDAPDPRAELMHACKLLASGTLQLRPTAQLMLLADQLMSDKMDAGMAGQRLAAARLEMDALALMGKCRRCGQAQMGKCRRCGHPITPPESVDDSASRMAAAAALASYCSSSCMCFDAANTVRLGGAWWQS